MSGWWLLLACLAVGVVGAGWVGFVALVELISDIMNGSTDE